MAGSISTLADEAKISKSEPALIKADEMHYDAEAHTVLAIGNVEVEQQPRLVFADRMLYEQDKNLVTAMGNVILVEPDGKVFFSDYAEFKDDLKSGTIEALKGRFPNNAALAANGAVKESETITKLYNAVFSPCNCDKENGFGTGYLWQVRAADMKIDDDAQKVSYHDAWFDIFGQPAGYTPYFSHPTPNADEESGLLSPTFGSISTLGAVARIPYFIAFKDNYDATITPIITTEEGPVLAAEMRHVLDNGFYQFNGSVTEPTDRTTDGITVPATRGNIAGFGVFNLENNWDWGFAGEWASDDTYLQRYEFGSQDRLTSRIYLEKLQDRDFVQVEGLSFQDLVVNTNPDAINTQSPIVLPSAQAHFESDPGFAGSRFVWDSSTANIYRSDGDKSSRLTTTGMWHIPYITDNGQLLDFSTHLRGDAYAVGDNVNPSDTTQDFSGVTGRAIPEAEADWSYPLINDLGVSRFFLEPVTNFIISPNGGNSFKIPNEDSQEVDLSDLNIFDPNRFSGYDRVESGPRVNYGFKGGLYGQDRGNVTFLFGQNYRTDTSYKYPEFSGFDNNFSDYVGRIAYTDEKYLDITYRFRLAEDNFTFNRNEVRTSVNIKPVSFDVTYVSVKRDPTAEDFISTTVNKDGEEIFSNVRWNINDQWSLTGTTRLDLAQDEQGWISNGLGLIFKNECLMVNSILNKNYTSFEDIRPSTTFLVRVTLLGLDGTGKPPAPAKSEMLPPERPELMLESLPQ